MTSPQNHADDGGVLRRATTRSASSALRLFVQGEMPAVDRRAARSCSPSGAGLRSRPTATAARSSAGARAGGGAAASTRWPSGASARSSTSRSTTRWSQIGDPGVPRPPPPGRRRDVVKVVEKTDPDEKVGRRRERRRPPGDDRVLRPARRACRAARRRTAGLELWAGIIAIHLIDVAFVEPGWRAAADGCRSTARSSRCRTSTTPGGRVEPDDAERGEVRAVHLRRPPAGRARRSWSRPTARPSSSRSRTRPGPTRPRRSGRG